ncbi:hypothetical protein A3C23_05055 [Candidatus Roizmanbacteria bacterium RIFCSPHIGHO2_02_FULL_37_13b]|uniref:NAD-dependent epimerase/dehydratase domain-containing protein n=1 Tax=Candidatus Roizmanbacteria bacterium RIFCSPLOWO2_02_FULL_36_11 TaxID=1802071 RepID=A0A1F7JIM4_9BACT|nr:MAG: hypothetical protein A3C23_05055 [Candidatus Roizmanbacteria bacterium RIFCSPHIGHO2_02_FULL_37_13b]OGK55463.1 MAG: hypothetical protein A3H78_01240 [Candidatus Roizmanbacteria bacterium RIFCSPLOWO2_02_FULL_36_11]
MKQRIVITGASGIIGSVLIKNLQNDFDLTPLSRQNCDLTDFLSLIKNIPKNTDVIIHLAWDKKPIYENGIFKNDNFLMTHNVFEAAVRKKIKRVILASSMHADEYGKKILKDVRDGKWDAGYGSGKLEIIPFQTSSSNLTPHTSSFNYHIQEQPTSIYGATKLYFEALGRYYAAYHNLEVVAIRFGGVNKENSPTAKKEPNYDKIFLSHQDLIRIVKQYIEKDLGESKYECVLAISKS